MVGSMPTPAHFKIAADHAEYRPVGEVNFHEAIALLCGAITYAREKGVKKLLIVSTGLTGFGPPTTLERFQIGKDTADAAQGAVVVALVTQPEMIDPQRFGRTVARNRSFLVDVFTTEAEALAWLRATEPVSGGNVPRLNESPRARR
jgi:hypothetical protein